jgi:hypothetical protein
MFPIRPGVSTDVLALHLAMLDSLTQDWTYENFAVIIHGVVGLLQSPLEA